MKNEAPQIDLLEKCRVLLTQCRINISESMDNKADRLTVLHQLEILEMLLQGLHPDPQQK